MAIGSTKLWHFHIWKRYFVFIYFPAFKQFQLIYGQRKEFISLRHDVYSVDHGIFEKRYVINRPFDIFKPLSDLYFSVVFKIKLNKLLKEQKKEIKEKGERLF